MQDELTGKSRREGYDFVVEAISAIGINPQRHTKDEVYSAIGMAIKFAKSIEEQEVQIGAEFSREEKLRLYRGIFKAIEEGCNQVPDFTLTLELFRNCLSSRQHYYHFRGDKHGTSFYTELLGVSISEVIDALINLNDECLHGLIRQARQLVRDTRK